jgi:hypothetical protein
VVNEAQHTYAYVTQETRLWAGAADVEVCSLFSQVEMK